LERPITQATGHRNTIVIVYEDRIELRSGWQGQNVESMKLRDVSVVGIRGVVNVTMTVENNTGRIYRLERMALPDARRVKNAVEQQKRRASLYE
jgi:hypothetical protein